MYRRGVKRDLSVDPFTQGIRFTLRRAKVKSEDLPLAYRHVDDANVCTRTFTNYHGRMRLFRWCAPSSCEMLFA